MSTQPKIMAVWFLMALCLHAGGANGQEWTPERKAGLTAAGVKYGLTTVRAIAAASDSEFPPPTGNVSDVQRKALEKTLGGYVKFRASAQGAMMSLQSGTELFIDGTAVTMAATGVGAVPAAVFKATAQVAADAFFSSMQDNVNESLALYLKKKEPELLQAAGGDYESLKADTPQNIKARLDQQSTIFAEINSMVGADPIAQERAQELVITAIRNTSKATLDLIDNQDVRLNGIESKFTSLNASFLAFEATTNTTLKLHEDALGFLQKDMGILQTAVSSIDKRLATQERNSAFVVDFVFDRMDPASKAAALKGGFMAERFACPSETPTCDGPELKADLIIRFEAEARIRNYD